MRGQFNSPPPLWFFQKIILQGKDQVLLFVTFNIIENHIFPEYIIKNLNLFNSFSSSILAIFINFLDFLAFLSCKETIDIRYSRWHQLFFFTYNLLEISCLTVASSYIIIRLLHVEIWSGRGGGGRKAHIPHHHHHLIQKTCNICKMLSFWWRLLC